MTYRNKSIIFWTLTVLFTLSIAIYQRLTGPTYPQTGVISINDEMVRYRMLTSSDSRGDAESYVKAQDTSISGTYQYKRFKVDEEWKTREMKREGDKLVLYLPHQPPAGKLEYKAFLEKDGKVYEINDGEPIVIRFKGYVPRFILFSHIFFMFGAMLFSTRTGIEVLIKGKNVYAYTWSTVICLLIGGMILGPVIQKFAFGDLWTGWPYGQDLTDNKTLVAFLAWAIAIIRQWRNRKKTGWALVASIILLIVYLIPHSLLGSELDYSTGEVVTGK